MSLKTINVISTPCLVADNAKVQGVIEDWVAKSPSEKSSGLSVDFTNAHIVAARSVEPEFLEITSSVDYFVPDSQILTWAVQLNGGSESERVYGPNFLDYSVREGATALKHYFIGGNQECLDHLLHNLKAIQPDLKVVGFRNGYFKPEEEEEIVAAIAATDADIVWVGLGTPKQQAFINQWKSSLPNKAMLAVGFAFDVNAGTKKDAPKFLGPLGLTWLYRLCMEPKRLFSRYLKYNTIFLYKLLLQKD